MIESFDIGVFVEAVPWWDYSTDSATRSFCYSAGWASDEIDLEVTTEATFRECYKTILYNLEDPFGVFTNEYEDFMAWTACDASSSTDVTAWNEAWFEETDDQTEYWVGGEIEYDNKSVCAEDVFANNSLAADLFDIAVGFAADRNFGKSPKQAKKALRKNKHKAAQ